MGAEITLYLGVDVSAKREGDKANIKRSGDSEGSRLFDKVLVATGRPPQLGELKLAKADLKLDDPGTPCFDRTTMQYGDAPVFMAGDANADAPILHEASNEGGD